MADDAGSAGQDEQKSQSGRVITDPAAVMRVLAQTVSKYKEQSEKIRKDYGDGGRLGEWIGKLEYQAANIALITIVGLLLILAYSVIGLVAIDAQQKEGLSKIEDVKNVILSILGLTGTILGYIFGKSGQIERQNQDKSQDKQSKS